VAAWFLCRAATLREGSLIAPGASNNNATRSIEERGRKDMLVTTEKFD